MLTGKRVSWDDPVVAIGIGLVIHRYLAQACLMP